MTAYRDKAGGTNFTRLAHAACEFLTVVKRIGTYRPWPPSDLKILAGCRFATDELAE